jgi:hypothetical protein
MSGATSVVQAALVAALAARPALASAVSGIFDGPPPRAAYPYVLVDDGATTDWSTKTASGREHRLAITIWDDGASAARLQNLMAEAEAAIEAMPRSLTGHRVASLVFLRARVVRDPDGPWAGLIEYRARTIEV